MLMRSIVLSADNGRRYTIVRYGWRLHSCALAQVTNQRSHCPCKT